LVISADLEEQRYRGFEVLREVRVSRQTHAPSFYWTRRSRKWFWMHFVPAPGEYSADLNQSRGCASVFIAYTTVRSGLTAVKCRWLSMRWRLLRRSMLSMPTV